MSSSMSSKSPSSSSDASTPVTTTTMDTTTIAPTSTSRMPTSRSTSVSTPTQTPATVKTKLRITIRFVNVTNKDEVLQKNSTEEKEFKEKVILAIVFVIRQRNGRIVVVIVVIIEIRSGSLLVDTEITIEGSSPSHVQDVVQALQDKVKTGTLGGYQTDIDQKLNATVTIPASQYTGKSTEKPTDEPKVAIILLSVAVGVLGIMIIIVLILTCVIWARRKKDYETN